MHACASFIDSLGWKDKKDKKNIAKQVLLLERPSAIISIVYGEKGHNLDVMQG